MPHVQLTEEEIAKHYPSLEAVDDLDLPDLSRLEDEQLYAAGMEVVQNILREMSEVGRTRRQGGISGLNDLPANQERRSDSGKERGHDYSGYSPGGAMCAAEEGVNTTRAIDIKHHIERIEGSSNARVSGHDLWQLPFRDKERVNRVAASDRSKESLAGFPGAAKVRSDFDPPEAAKGKSTVTASCPESDRCAHLFGFAKLPRFCDERMTQDGTTYRVVRRSEDEGEIGLRSL